MDSAYSRGSKVAVVEKSGEVFHLKREKDYHCGTRLNNTNRQICQAMMSIDLRIFEAATDKYLKMKIRQSLPGNDDCCEIIYRLKNEK